MLRRQHHVLHLRPPNTFDPNVELAARQRLGDHTDQLHAGEALRVVDLDHKAHHVLAVEEDRAWIGERQLAGCDRRQRRRGVHDERIPARTGEDANAVRRASLLVVHAEGDRLAAGYRAGALLIVALRVAAGGGEHTVEGELFSHDRERHRMTRHARRERVQAEAVDKPVREEIRGLGEGAGVHHENDVARPFGARERVDVCDVRDGLRQGSWSRDVVRHRRVLRVSAVRQLGTGLVQQRLQSAMLQRLGGLRIVQHLLERIIDTLLLADLHHGATVIARVRGRGLLGTGRPS